MRALVSLFILASVVWAVGSGLKGIYYSDSDFTEYSSCGIYTKIENVNVGWGTGDIFSNSKCKYDYGVTVRWVGYIKPPQDGEYRFEMDSDDGSILYLDGNKLIEYWSNHGMGSSKKSKWIKLKADQYYPIRVDYYENNGDAAIWLKWQKKGEGSYIIPSTYLYTPEKVHAVNGSPYSHDGGFKTPRNPEDKDDSKDTRNIKGDIRIIGNTVQCVSPGGGCTDSLDDSNDDSPVSYLFANSADSSDNLIFNSSYAELNLPSNDAEIRWAGLYWQGNIYDLHGDSFYPMDMSRWSYAADSVLFKTSENEEYSRLFADDFKPVIDKTSGEEVIRAMYGAFKDVTELVKNRKSDRFYMANIKSMTEAITTTEFGAWALVVIFEDDDEPKRNISVFDGYKRISGSNEVNIEVSGFITPAESDISSTLAIFVGEGETENDDDEITMYDNKFGAVPGAKAGNFAQSKIISDDPFVRYPEWTNTNGIDIHQYNVSKIMEKKRTDQGGTSVRDAKITLSSGGDRYMAQVVAFTTELYEPNICYVEHYYKEKIEWSSGESPLSITSSVKLDSDTDVANQDDELDVIVQIFNMDKQPVEQLSVIRKFDDDDGVFEYIQSPKNCANSDCSSLISSAIATKGVDHESLSYVPSTDDNDDDNVTYSPPSDNQLLFHVGNNSKSTKDSPYSLTKGSNDPDAGKGVMGENEYQAVKYRIRVAKNLDKKIENTYYAEYRYYDDALGEWVPDKKNVEACKGFEQPIILESIGDICYLEEMYHFNGSPDVTSGNKIDTSADSTDSITLGDNILYRITLRNETNDNLSDVILKKTFDDMVTYPYSETKPKNYLYTENDAGGYTQLTDANDTGDFGIYFDEIDTAEFKKYGGTEYTKNLFEDTKTALIHVGDSPEAAYYPDRSDKSDSNRPKGGTIKPGPDETHTIYFVGKMEQLPRDSNNRVIPYENKFEVAFVYDKNGSPFGGSIELCDKQTKQSVPVHATGNFIVVDKNPATTPDICERNITTKIVGQPTLVKRPAQQFWIASCFDTALGVKELEAVSNLVDVPNDLNFTIALDENTTPGNSDTAVFRGDTARIEKIEQPMSPDVSFWILSTDMNFTSAKKDVFFKVTNLDQTGKNSNTIKGSSASIIMDSPYSYSNSFAIRPHRFDLNLSAPRLENGHYLLRAGEGYDLNVTALDVNGKPVPDYNETLKIPGIPDDLSVELNATETRNACIQGRLMIGNVDDRNFTDGNLSLVEVRYSEASFRGGDIDMNGTVELNVTEIDGFQYAWSVDGGDDFSNADYSLSISPASLKLTIVPYEINISEGTFEYNRTLGRQIVTDRNWTYMDTELDGNNVGIGFTLSAYAKDRNITSNFSHTCDAVDVNTSFHFEINATDDKDTVMMAVRETNNSQTLGIFRDTSLANFVEYNLTAYASDFTDGNSTPLRLNFNIDRNGSRKLDPIRIALTDLNITNNINAHNSTIPTRGDNNTTTFLYGRINPIDSKDDDFDGKVNAPIYFEVFGRKDKNLVCSTLGLSCKGSDMSYNDIYWWPNPKHPKEIKVDHTKLKAEDKDEPSKAIYGDSGTFAGGIFQKIKITKDSSFHGVVRTTIPHDELNLNYLYYNRYNESNRSYFNATFLSKGGTPTDVTKNPTPGIGGGSRIGW